MKMNMPKLTIRGVNRFAAVALFTDQEKVEVFVLSTRLRFHGHSLPVSYEEKVTIGRDIFYELTSEEQLHFQWIHERIELLANSPDISSKKEIENLENEVRTLMYDKLHFEDDLEKFLNGNKYPLSYKTVLSKLILTGEIHDGDFVGKGLPGRFDVIKKQRSMYWKNKRSVNRQGYKTLAKAADEEMKTIEQQVRSYTRRLKGF